MKDDEALVQEKEQKKTFNIMIFFSVFTVVLNGIVSPISLFIGAMGTDAPGSGFQGFMFGFLFVQGIPLLLFIIAMSTMLIYSRKVNRSDFMTTYIRIMLVINIVVLPASLIIGQNAKDLEDGGALEFAYGFLFIQIIHLALLLIGILTFRRITPEKGHEAK